MIDQERCGWLSDYPTLRSTPAKAITLSLRDFLHETNPAQLKSWDETVPIVQRETAKTLTALAAASKFTAILEYELPREGGRRPDVISLQNGVVIVLEFKEHSSPLPPHLDQAGAYARDIKNYHEKSHALEVVPVLVPQAYIGQRQQINSVHVLPPAQLGDFLLEQALRNTGTVIDPEDWINSEYAPLPSLVRAARMLFNGEPLPRIKRAQSARVPEVVDLILSICHEAAATESRHLVILTGAPGSGKTLVGLQLAHNEKLEDLWVKRPGKQGGAPAVFLSGNGPLVEVLQDALQNRAFVAGMKKFIDYYGFKRPNVIPSEHVLIFDEAQRAWDAHHMAAKHGTAISEPEKLLEIASRIPKWCVVVALVGEGQEIHKGEEAGLAGWQTALGKVQDDPAAWTIHGPPHALALFDAVPRQTQPTDLLNLSTSLRSHLASSIHEWVKRLLETDRTGLADLRRLASEMRAVGFQTYATREIEAARSYARERYTGNLDARYGLLASRYAKNLRPIGIDNTYHFQREEQLKVGPWFNAEPANSLSCCALRRPATEFECQGLELDFPIVCWGDDLFWNTSHWHIPEDRRRSVTDRNKVTRNAYRVLLTRGRDGMIIFVPPEPDLKLDSTYALLVGAGCCPL